MRLYFNLILFPEKQLICPYIYKKVVWEGDTYLMNKTEYRGCQGVPPPEEEP